MTKNSKDKNQTEAYLKKLQQQSPQQKKQQALKILRREQPKTSSFFQWFQPWQQRLSQTYQLKKKQFIKQARYSQNRHLFIVTVFFIGAVWISWTIEDKYDKMRTRANSTKSIKKRQVEAQNEYIQKMLSKNEFQPVPIEQQQKQAEDYIYKNTDLQFDTRADLLQILQRQKGMMKDEQIQRL